MPLIIVREDILKMEVDCIVTPSNPDFIGTKGIHGLICKAEGDKYLEQLQFTRKPKIKEVYMINAYTLPCKYIINVINPWYIDGKSNEENMLRVCYRNILDLAYSKGLESIAIPILSSGYYDFPKDLAIRICKEEILSFLEEYELDIFIVLFDDETYKLSFKHFDKIKDFINSKQVINYEEYEESLIEEDDDFGNMDGMSFSLDPDYYSDLRKERDKVINEMQEKTWSFTECLFQLIDSKGLTDVEAYKKSNISRKVFSKIRCDQNYKPSKETVLSFCIGLELGIKESNLLLETAGFALSRYIMVDKVVAYHIMHKLYNIHEINGVLFDINEKGLSSYK